ncbi:MAG TPA: ribonuclease III [Zeimonas sp.]|nr:ribonuclease III [Zeimonas sp.]
MDLDALQRQLGHRFADEALLRQALTHRSYGQPNNERLEFLGDSVLNCVVAAMLYRHFARIDEGDLSRLRANLVKQQSLVEIAQRLGLSAYLLLGEGEAKSGGFRRPSILGDTVEAIVGAVFLDGGFEAAQSMIVALYEPILKTVDPKTLGKDAKTLLQEHLQGKRLPLPVYSVVATHGAAHSQVFEVECAIPKLQIRVLGSGSSRRAAEQAAARGALDAAQAKASARRSRGRSPQSRRESAPEEGSAPAAPDAPDDPDPPKEAGGATATNGANGASVSNGTGKPGPERGEAGVAAVPTDGSAPAGPDPSTHGTRRARAA